MSISITVNGEPRQYPEGTVLTTVIGELVTPGSRFAVEINREIVPRSQHGDYRLRPDDQLEIVTAIGGG
ncbi:MAG: sulfur carrier protein ThiS [Gammaproteobacteria bacterium]|nr:sulfur carrier protein ThiS [Gammaproteobacteria bacterium]